MPRPKSDNPTIQRWISVPKSEWEWLELWFPTGNESGQVRELIARAKKFWPDGPNGSGAIKTRKSRIGGVRDLRQKIRLLESQLLKAGLEPVTRQAVTGNNTDS